MFESLLLSPLHILSNNPHEIIAAISPFLQLRLREVKNLPKVTHLVRYIRIKEKIALYLRKKQKQGGCPQGELPEAFFLTPDPSLNCLGFLSFLYTVWIVLCMQYFRHMCIHLDYPTKACICSRRELCPVLPCISPHTHTQCWSH